MGAITDRYVSAMRQLVGAWPPSPHPDEVNRLLRLLGMWRQRMLVATYIQHHGLKVYSGPFAGMEYVGQATEGALIPRLIGTYESELHPYLKRFADGGLDCVVDVGCAEGYYAVGLARLLPGAEVYAHDIDEKAQAACRDLAARNDVADRVRVGGEFRPEDFQAFEGRRVLVIVDAEGAEVDILQPDRGPALAGMNIIVETHDQFRPNTLATLVARFEGTHDIVRLDTGPKGAVAPPWLRQLGHMDQLLAYWEWRALPTPWLVMTPKTA